MENNIKISVIVPVYNVAQYLPKCLDTIINQTFKDIEIICVDDGSTDNSGEILSQYAKKDHRIIIIEKQNGGLSSARNAGLNVAKGEFIVFIDSDDWVDERFCEKLYDSITKNNADISICAVHQYDSKTGENDDSNPYYTLGFFDESFDNRVFSHKDTKDFICDVCVMAWNKIYRRSFLDGLHARFPEGLIFEDGPFFFTIFFKTDRITIVRDYLYYYRINRKNSIIGKGDKKFFDIFTIITLMYDKLKMQEYFDEVKYEFFRKKTEDIMYRCKTLKPSLRPEFCEKIRHFDLFYNNPAFDFNYIDKEFPYLYDVITAIKKGGYKQFKREQLADSWKYKIMEILYHEQNVYFIHSKKFHRTLRIKKRPKYYDIWYDNDTITVVLFSKFKFVFKFVFSTLERRNKKRV